MLAKSSQTARREDEIGAGSPGRASMRWPAGGSRPLWGATLNGRPSVRPWRGPAMSWFFYLRGYLNEGRERLPRLLDMTGPAASAALQTVVQAEALDAAGSLALFQWDHAAARAFMEKSLALKRELGDERGVASSLTQREVMAYRQGDNPTARPRLEESVAVWRKSDDRAGLGLSLNVLEYLALDQGDYAMARAGFEERLAIQREAGIVRNIHSQSAV